MANRLLANSSYELDYEPYGSEPAANPDFRVRLASGLYNVEVKRIREGVATVLYNECTAKIVKELARSHLKHAGRYAVNRWTGPELANRLHAAIDSVVAECAAALNRWKVK